MGSKVFDVYINVFYYPGYPTQGMQSWDNKKWCNDFIRFR
jgi:hypothetical protein